MLMPSCYLISSTFRIGRVVGALLRCDLAISLDGELVVGLEGRDGTVWDLGTARVSACIRASSRRMIVAYVKPFIRVNSWTWARQW